MRAHFDTLLDSKGYLIRDFTNEERLWILIESTYCKLDLLYFSSNYAKIEDWSARIVYFNPNIAQNIILGVMSEYEEKMWAIMLMLLKARQLGMTTFFQVVLAHRIFFYKNVVAYTGSAEEKKSRAMVEKLEFLWNNLPWWLRPRQTAAQAGDFLKFGDIHSSLWVQWGNQKQGIGGGGTPPYLTYQSYLHLRNLKSWLMQLFIELCTKIHSPSWPWNRQLTASGTGGIRPGSSMLEEMRWGLQSTNPSSSPGILDPTYIQLKVTSGDDPYPLVGPHPAM